MVPVSGTFTAVALATLLVSGTLRLKNRLYDERLTLTFFDVGQGDASLVAFPRGGRWMIDGGGAFLEKHVGRKTVFGELTSDSILTVDTLLLSHPDLDHGEGLLPLLSELKVKQLLFPALFLAERPRKLLLSQLLARAAVRGTPTRGVATPETFPFPGGRGELIPVPGKTTNDRALVVRLTYGKCSVVYTGDLEREGEQWLANYAKQNHWPPVTVLKAAHHGSKTSSHPPLLKALRPKLATVSTGLANTYGHPNPFALERLRQWGAETLRTDFHGHIRITFKDDRYHCHSASGSCGAGPCR